MGECADLCGHLIVGKIGVLALKTVKALTHILLYNIIQPVAVALVKWIQSFATSNYESPYMERIDATRTNPPDTFHNLLGNSGIYLNARVPERDPFMSDADLTFLDLTSKKQETYSFNESSYCNDFRSRSWERFRRQMDADDDYIQTQFRRYGFVPRS